MNFKFRMRTVVHFGRNCLATNPDDLTSAGDRALIVTGKKSGKLSGALDDVIKILEESGIKYLVFDNVENNPTTGNIDEGAKLGRSFGADFAIGIGGGSPLDAAKAIAVLLSNDIKAADLFSNRFENPMSPVICIPTTAGTGSEVTPYSILTNKDINSKKSFGNDMTFPSFAFLDPRYTDSMSHELTVNTAIDTLSHGIESIMTIRSTPFSDMAAMETCRLFGECANALLTKNIDDDTRDKLLYMSMLGGLAIAQSGTTIVHGMGYSLTYFKGIHHGRANGLLLSEFLKFNNDVLGRKIDAILDIMGIKTIEGFSELMRGLLGKGISLTDAEIENFSEISFSQPSIATSAKKVTKQDIAGIFERSAKR